MLVNCNPLRKLGFISRRHGGAIARWEEIAEEIFGSSRLSIRFTREEGTTFERGSRHRFKDYLLTSYRMLRRKLRDNKLHACVLVFLRNFHETCYFKSMYYYSYFDPLV